MKTKIKELLVEEDTACTLTRADNGYIFEYLMRYDHSEEPSYRKIKEVIEEKEFEDDSEKQLVSLLFRVLAFFDPTIRIRIFTESQYDFDLNDQIKYALSGYKKELANKNKKSKV